MGDVAHIDIRGTTRKPRVPSLLFSNKTNIIRSRPTGLISAASMLPWRRGTASSETSTSASTASIKSSRPRLGSGSAAAAAATATATPASTASSRARGRGGGRRRGRRRSAGQRNQRCYRGRFKQLSFKHRGSSTGGGPKACFCRSAARPFPAQRGGPGLDEGGPRGRQG